MAGLGVDTRLPASSSPWEVDAATLLLPFSLSPLFSPSPLLLILPCRPGALPQRFGCAMFCSLPSRSCRAAPIGPPVLQRPVPCSRAVLGTERPRLPVLSPPPTDGSRGGATWRADAALPELCIEAQEQAMVDWTGSVALRLLMPRLGYLLCRLLILCPVRLVKGALLDVSVVSMGILRMFLDIRLCFMGTVCQLVGILWVMIPRPICRIRYLGLLYRQRIHQSLIGFNFLLEALAFLLIPRWSFSQQ